MTKSPVQKGHNSTTLAGAFMLVVLITASYFLFYGGPDYLADRSLKELWNLGHIVYFALLATYLARFRIITRLSTGQQ